MPREKINDPDTEGLYVQVNWRAHNEIPDSTAPGHVQISTHDERQDARVIELLEAAGSLLAGYGEEMTGRERPGWSEWRAKFFGDITEFRAELTGTYVTLTPETIGPLLRTIHKARRQVWPPEAATGSTTELARQGPPVIPREGELPAPGATGYPVTHMARRAVDPGSTHYLGAE
jgi:hypothetical protein